jgi:hypothetical protein
MENTKQCFLCENGFTLDQSTNQCIDEQIEFCRVSTNGTDCLNCDASFYVLNGQCEYCGTFLRDCEYCIQAGEDSDAPQCMACTKGHYLRENGCIKCPQNCLSCTEDECMMCGDGFVLSPQKHKCIPCKASHCRSCLTQDTCSACENGWYIKEITKTCEK